MDQKTQDRELRAALVVFGFAVRVKLPTGRNLKGWLWVYGTACKMLKIGSSFDDLACRLPPPVIRWIMDERSVLLLLLLLLLLGKSSIARRPGMQGP